MCSGKAATCGCRLPFGEALLPLAGIKVRSLVPPPGRGETIVAAEGARQIGNVVRAGYGTAGVEDEASPASPAKPSTRKMRSRFRGPRGPPRAVDRGGSDSL